MHRFVMELPTKKKKMNEKNGPCPVFFVCLFRFAFAFALLG